MTAQEAKKLYEDNWCLEFTNLEALLQRVAAKALLGASEDFVHIDSESESQNVRAELFKLGYSAEDYNGSNSGGILEISW